MVVSVEEDSIPDLNEAKELYSKYELKEILGRGVSSVVRRCVEKVTQKECAVKIIDLTQDDPNSPMSTRACTLKEIQILRICAQQPGIIELYDSFESPTFMFLVFELCRKGELFDYMTEVVTMSEKRTRQIMRQLLSTVEFIHSKMILHRDLKPENILLDDDLQIKLSDFGFALIINNDEELDTGELVGTPSYMSPEAIKKSMFPNEPGYGRPSDMWSVGVIMYTLLTGVPPFYHRNEMRMLRMIMAGSYSMDASQWSDISESARDLMTKLLVTNPKLRLTAQEALAHPFLLRKVNVKFCARRKFKASVFSIIALSRLQYFHRRAPEISVGQLRKNPYHVRTVHKFIDTGAFKIYGHWIKKGNQNRAIFFQTKPRIVTNSSSE